MSSTTFICIICSEPLTPNNMFSISCGHLNVREPSGNITVLEKIKSSDTIELIKCMVEMKIGIPPDQHRLIYMGKQLEDDRTIAYYDIEDGATIHLIMRLKGC
uniref:Ubiquitin-like domain-containing protein n=1 Tax=Meloidogyne javanica TaxID=6303 RepID=A0A915MVT3_MELJA